MKMVWACATGIAGPISAAMNMAWTTARNLDELPRAFNPHILVER